MRSFMTSPPSLKRQVLMARIGRRRQCFSRPHTLAGTPIHRPYGLPRQPGNGGQAGGRGKRGHTAACSTIAHVPVPHMGGLGSEHGILAKSISAKINPNNTIRPRMPACLLACAAPDSHSPSSLVVSCFKHVDLHISIKVGTPPAIWISFLCASAPRHTHANFRTTTRNMPFSVLRRRLLG